MITTLRLLLFFLFLSHFPSLKAQEGWRYFFSMSPTYSVGNRFEGNVKRVGIPDLTGYHELKPLLSLYWDRSHASYTKAQNFARQFNYSIYAEKCFTSRHSLMFGSEIGARGYYLYSEQSEDLLLMYRNVNIPVMYVHSNAEYHFWRFRKYIGGAINYARSVEKITERFVDVRKNPTYYFTGIIGLEMAYLESKGPFTFNLEYQQGFKNVIDHNYLALDYYNGVHIYSKGSHFRLGIKWYFAETKPKMRFYNADDAASPYLKNIDFEQRKEYQPIVMKVKEGNFSVCVNDGASQDNDSISIESNGFFIADNIALTKVEQCFDLSIKKGETIRLKIHALNLGKQPPNTCNFMIKSSEKTEPVLLKSNLVRSAVIDIVAE